MATERDKLGQVADRCGHPLQQLFHVSTQEHEQPEVCHASAMPLLQQQVPLQQLM
jgi:hypothetical protein